MNKRYLTSLLVTGLLFTAGTHADVSAPSEERYAYVIGASVSLGFNVFGKGYSPPLFALQQMGYERSQIVKETKVSGSFRNKFKWLKRKFETHPPSIVMGLDLFHHDLRQKNSIAPRTYAYVDEILQYFEDQNIPFIIGYTWTRYENRATIDEMNAYLTEQQEKYKNLHLFPVPDVFDALYFKDNTYEYDVGGVQFQMSKRLGRKLLLDVVHPNERGARVFANMLLDIVNSYSDPDYPYYPVDDIVALADRISVREQARLAKRAAKRQDRAAE